jgi:Kelch motif
MRKLKMKRKNDRQAQKLQRREYLSSIGGMLTVGAVNHQSDSEINESNGSTDNDDRNSGGGGGSRSQSTGYWEQLADMPTGASGTGRAGVPLGGKLYSFSGILTDVNKPEGQDGELVNTVWISDPSDGQKGAWKRGPAMPQKLSSVAAAVANEKVYIFGGAKPGGGPWNGQDTLVDKIYRFDPTSSKKWKDVTPPDGMPQGGLYGASAVYSQHTDRIYIVAGGMGEPNAPNSQRIWTFRPGKNTIIDPNWATLPADMAARWGSAAILSDNGSKYLHAFGGMHYTPGGTIKKHVRYKLSVGDSSEEAMAPLPHAGGKLASGVVSNRLYATLGIYDESGDWSMSDFKNHLMMYTPVSDSWSTDLPEISKDRVRDPGATGIINGKMYIAGGHLKEYEGDNRNVPNAAKDDHIVKPWTDVFHVGRHSGG